MQTFHVKPPNPGDTFITTSTKSPSIDGITKNIQLDDSRHCQATQSNRNSLDSKSGNLSDACEKHEDSIFEEEEYNDPYLRD